MATGGDAATWGVIANTQFQSFEAAITGDNGYAGGAGGINLTAGQPGVSGNSYTLTANNGTADQARELLYPFVGTLTAGCTVLLPGVVKIGWVLNATTGGFGVTLQVGAGTTLTIPPGGGWTLFYCDGANVTAPSLTFGSGVGPITVNGNATINGNISITGLQTLAGVLDMPNNVPIRMQDAGGTYRNILFSTSGNLTQLLGGVNGLTIANSSGTSLLGFAPGGTATFGQNALGPSFTATGGLTSAPGVSGWAYGSTGASPFSGATLTYGMVASGTNMLAVNYYAASDVRLKLDIAEITPEAALDWVMSARPVTYRKLPSYDAPEETAVIEAGFIAQDQVRAGYGRYVGTAPCEGMPERVDPDGLRSLPDVSLNLTTGYQVAYLTRVVQHLLAEIADLKAIIGPWPPECLSRS
jgi:Chaperone of endosialidase